MNRYTCNARTRLFLNRLGIPTYVDRFLMVVGGTPDDDSVEVVSLDANFPVPSCLQELGSFPDGGRVRGAGAALLPGTFF